MIHQWLRETIDTGASLPALMEPVGELDEPGAMAVCQRPTLANPEGFTEDHIAYQHGAGPAKDAIELRGPWFADAQFAAVAAHPANGDPPACTSPIPRH